MYVCVYVLYIRYVYIYIYIERERDIVYDNDLIAARDAPGGARLTDASIHM